MGFKTLKLGELGKTVVGGDKPAVFSECRTEECNIPIYSNGIEKEGLYGFTDKARVFEKCFTISARGTVGAVFHRDEPFFPIVRLIAYIPDEKIVNEKYLYYLLKLYPLAGFGTSQQQITVPYLSKQKVCIIESLPTQRRIASILSTYDSLIENNTRRIRLLEQMAENLYKEWFVYHKIKDTATIVRLRDILSIVRGLSYSSEEIDCEDGNDLINLKNIQAFGGFRLDGTKKYNGKYKPQQVVKEGDLVMGVTDMTQDRRTVGSVALIPNVVNLSVISADLIKLESDIDNTYLYSMFRFGNVSRYIAQFANGANVLHLRPQAVENIKIMLPNREMINAFVDAVKPMFAEINKLNSQNASLARQRDLLLPRLMSGKIEV